MRIIFLLFFIGLGFSLLSQEHALLTLEKLEISNKKLTEYNFIPTDKGAFFISNKMVARAVQVKDSKENNLSNIYYCSRKKNKIGVPKIVDINFYNHIGSFAVNDKGDYIIFTGRQNKTATTFGLFQTEKIRGKWSDPVLVIKNMESFNFTDPFLSKSGDTLWFSTDMPGGKGGLDLYYGTGTIGNWKEFINLGSEINTSDNERFPCLYKNTLFFSSKREGGVGGMDIYANPIVNGDFTQTVLLNNAANSTADDFAVAFDGNDIYFSSNRDGSDDIFVLASKFPEFDCVQSVPLVRCYEFSDEHSESKDSTAFVYKWNMGDGTEYDGVVADHCYKDSGTYIVELNIYDIITKKIIATEESFELIIEDPEQLDIVIPEIVKSGFPLEFKILNDNRADSSTYYWDFGDGQYAIGEKVIHNYLQNGTFELAVGRVYFIDGEEFRICTSTTVRVK